MILKYGTYAHPLGSVKLSISGRRRLRTDAGTPYGFEESWTIDGMLTSQDADPRTDIKNKTAALEAAYMAEGKDLILYFPDGTTQTAHKILHSETLGGIRVMNGPYYRDGTTVEGVTKREFTIEIQAIKLDSSAPTWLKSFEESLTFSPAGAKYGHVETLIGPPQQQLLRRQQTYRAAQRGSTVGILSRPYVPAAIWPFALVDTEPLVTEGTPRRIGNQYTEYPISWEWLYESAFRLYGSAHPHVWGVNYP